MKKKMIMGAALFMAVCAQSAVIYNGDLSAPVNKEGNNGGKTIYFLDASTEKVNYYVTGESTNTTTVGVSEWMISKVSRGFEYSRTGGVTGDGAFVQHSDNAFNGKPRSVFQFAKDNKATKGSIDIKIDVFLDDNSSGADTLSFWVDLYAWNTGEDGVCLSVWEKSLDNLGTDAVTLLDTVVLSSGTIANAAWTTVDVGTIDLGTGYDYYAWRISVLGAGVDDIFAFDNVVVPEPATMGLLSMVMMRR